MYSHQYDQHRAAKLQDGTEEMIRMRQPRTTGPHPPATRGIITEHVYPPIPVRHFDWSAVHDGYEPGQPIGTGATEAEAVADLLDQVAGELADAAADLVQAATSCSHCGRPADTTVCGKGGCPLGGDL